MKLFEIVKTNKTKYPYKVKYKDGTKVKVPSQYDFTNSSFIKSHGCIIAAFYMGLQFVGRKKSMVKCLKYLQDNYTKYDHINYNLDIVCKAINNICDEMPATFYGKITKSKMKWELKKGSMILFTERNPTHTAVILYDGKNFIRFSDGKYKKVTVQWEINKRCNDTWYKGCVIVRR